MFRTWRANHTFLQEICRRYINNGRSNKVEVNHDNQIKKNIKEAVEIISDKLHNTPAVSKKSYLDSNIINIYQKTPNKIYREIEKSGIGTTFTVRGDILSEVEDAYKILKESADYASRKLSKRYKYKRLQKERNLREKQKLVSQRLKQSMIEKSNPELKEKRMAKETAKNTKTTIKLTRKEKRRMYQEPKEDEATLRASAQSTEKRPFEWALEPWKKYAVFCGRARRKEFGIPRLAT